MLTVVDLPTHRVTKLLGVSVSFAGPDLLVDGPTVQFSNLVHDLERWESGTGPVPGHHRMTHAEQFAQALVSGCPRVLHTPIIPGWYAIG